MDIYFNGYKIKYEYLNSNLLPIRASRKIQSVNIYINIDDLLHRVHRPYSDKEFQCTGEGAHKQLLSNLINLVAHYKNWAIKSGLSPQIYLIYTTSRSFKNQLRNTMYREHYLHISALTNMEFFHINQCVDGAIALLPSILKYIPRAYAIDTSYIEPSIVPYFLTKNKPADLNIMVSRDEYDLQYAYMDNWLYISPKGENSSFVNKGTIWNYIRFKEKITEDMSIHPEIFLWCKSIIGDPYRGIPKLIRGRWKLLLKYLRESSIEIYNHDTLVLQRNALSLYLTKKRVSEEEFNTNLYQTSIVDQVESLFDIDKAMITQQIVDMEDYNAVVNVNNTIFNIYPLNLKFLFTDIPKGNIDPKLHKYFWMR